uniref:Novel ITAM-containing IgSF receptor 2 n=1 Tax=Eptatretus burgeri TaxID=7764 RepID=Q2ABQ0_EPTBU|nr:novel ITAM-containing IgSF receptor 2 [Eptatretus burgeri]
MSLSMFYRHSPLIHIPPWQLLYWAALLQGIFAQHKEKKCSISSTYTLCFLPEVLGTVDGDATIPCDLTFPETDGKITYMSWTKNDTKGLSFIQKYDNGVVSHLNREGTIKPPKQPDILGNVSSGEVSLKIRKLKLSDVGIYYCWFLASNIKKSETNNGFIGNNGTMLVVGEKPKISFVKQLMNGTIDLTCKGSGIPLPNLDLLDTNGAKLHSRKKSDAKEIKLQINLPEPASAGKYTCMGTNIHGETRVEIILGIHNESMFVTIGLIAGIVFLALILVTALTASIYSRRKTLGKRKGCENTSTCKVSPSSPTTLELPSQNTTSVNVCGTSSGQEATYEILRATSSGKETIYETLCTA